MFHPRLAPSEPVLLLELYFADLWYKCQPNYYRPLHWLNEKRKTFCLHAMRVYGEWGCSSTRFFTSLLDMSDQLHTPAALLRVADSGTD
jgi:hypothetical protein